MTEMFCPMFHDIKLNQASTIITQNINVNVTRSSIFFLFQEKSSILHLIILSYMSLPTTAYFLLLPMRYIYIYKNLQFKALGKDENIETIWFSQCVHVLLLCMTFIISPGNK